MTGLLAGDTHEELLENIRSQEAQQTAGAACYSVAEQVARLCDSHGLESCPACGSKFKSKELAKRVTFQLGASATSLDIDTSELENARRRLRSVDEAIAAAASAAGHAPTWSPAHDLSSKAVTVALAYTEISGARTG